MRAAFKQFILSWAMLLVGCSLLQAQRAELPEYEVKAAFLYNFIKFVEWPAQSFPDKDTPYIIGVLSPNPDPFFDPDGLNNYLHKTVEGKMINGRKLIIRREERASNLTDCHMVFISSSEKNRMRETLAILNKPGILTVSETENFCQQGGIINFYMASGKVRFEINIGAAENAQLKISSKLLNVARIVSTKSK